MKTLTQSEQATLKEAAAIMLRVIVNQPNIFNSYETVRDYLAVKLGVADREVFGVLYLDSKNALIKDEVLFMGTTTFCAVLPREVMRQALLNNAVSIILYHNHPSGNCEPSDTDRNMTRELVRKLKEIDINLIDHIIVAGLKTYSFDEKGLLK